MNNQNLDRVEKIIDKYEKELRSLGTVETYKVGQTQEFNFNLSKTSLKDFFKDFFYYNDIHAYDNQSGTLSYTREINSSTRLIENTTRGRRRSIGDLYRLALTYYSKEVSLYDVMEAMYQLVIENTVIQKSKGYGVMEMQICGQIFRRVFYCRYGSKSCSYGFAGDSMSNTNRLTNEPIITGNDYRLLFSTVDGREFLKNKRNPAKSISISDEELDRRVMEKLKKLATFA